VDYVLSTYGDRALPVAAVRIWNSLPAAYHVCSVTSRLLLSLEDILLQTLLPVITVVVPAREVTRLLMDVLIALIYLITCAL